MFCIFCVQTKKLKWLANPMALSVVLVLIISRIILSDQKFSLIVSALKSSEVGMNFKILMFDRPLPNNFQCSSRILCQRAPFRSCCNIELKSACLSPTRWSKVSLHRSASEVITLLSQLSCKHDNETHIVLFFLMGDNMSIHASNFDLRFLLNRLSLSITLDLVRPPVTGRLNTSGN